MNLGNLCIAGHNYKNEKFFSNLSKLENGDIIEVSDNKNNVIKYEVYSIYKTEQSDTSCVNQDTKGSKIITLITCDSINDNIRIVVKAKEVKPKEE